MRIDSAHAIAQASLLTSVSTGIMFLQLGWADRSQER